jgi:chromosome segregation ATPase
MMTAVLLALFFAVTLDTAQSGTIDIARIGERPVGLAELEGAYAEIAPRVEAENGQTSTSEDASQVQQVAATAVQVAQQSQKDGRAQAPVQELTEARLTIEGLEGRLRAEAAKSARLVEEEREKSAALAKEAAAARQELSAATAKHRQALAEERESRASLLATAAMKYRQELNAERERHTVLISEIAAVRREIEVQAAKFRQAGAETARLTQADATKTPQLPLGCGNTAALAQEAAAARQELTTNVEKQRQALDEERARSRALASELAKAQREIETQAVQRNASEETRRLRQPKPVTSTQPLDPAAREKATLARKAAAAR